MAKEEPKPKGYHAGFRSYIRAKRLAQEKEFRRLKDGRKRPSSGNRAV